MITTEVAVRRQTGLSAKVEYARELANSGMLPNAYRRQPANVLWAVEYGSMLGIAPMAAITGVHVIEGKPTASAGLISALVRRAGHKLRVKGDSESATCEIIRSDDPDYTFSVTFTAKDAQAAGLLNKDVWRKYRASMLKSRAITQCARDACEEALFGLHYTAEELGADDVDEDGAVIGEAVEATAEGAADALGGQPGTDDPWVVRDSLLAQTPCDHAWLDEARERAATWSDQEAGAALWHELVAKVGDRSITKADADEVKEIWLARNEDLKAEAAQDADVVEGVVVDYGGLESTDPWAEKVASITNGEDADAAVADVNKAVSAKSLTRAQGNRVIEAIDQRRRNLQAVAA